MRNIPLDQSDLQTVLELLREKINTQQASDDIKNLYIRLQLCAAFDKMRQTRFC